MADSTGITIDPTGRPTAADLAEEFDAKLRERRGDFEGYYTLKDRGDIGFKDNINNMRGISGHAAAFREFLKEWTKDKLGGPEEAITVEFPLAKGGPKPFNFGEEPQDGPGSPIEGRTAGSEEPRGMTPGEAWEALGGFIKDPERPMNPATLAAWGTWNLANMGVEGGKKMVQAWQNLEELMYGAGYQPGVGDEAGARAGASVATAVASGGLLQKSPAGSLRSFSGREGAENWAKAGRPQAQTALEMAEMLEKKGYSEGKIREMTMALADEGNFGGVSKGKDGKWRFEISEEAFELTTPFEKLKTGNFLGDIIKHDDLFLAHPEMGDIPVMIKKMSNLKGFKPSGGFDGEKILLEVRNAEDIRNVVAHEWQHWLQKKNDFARGANPDIQGPKNYRRSAGENEANSVQERLEMTNRERQEQHPSMNEVEPETGKRIPRSEQIVTMTDDLRAAGYEASTYSPRVLEKELTRKINTIQKRIDKLQIDLKNSDRFTPSALEKRRVNLMQQTDQLRKLLDKKEALNLPESPLSTQMLGPENIKLEGSRQGVPKTLSESVDKMAKRRSKLERLQEEAQSQQTIIDNETRQPRVERARKHLRSIERQIKKIMGE